MKIVKQIFMSTFLIVSMTIVDYFLSEFYLWITTNLETGREFIVELWL